MTIAVFNQKAPIYMRRLMDDFGFDALDAAAIMGNAGAESGGLTKFQEITPTVKGSRGGWGWFQWTGDRRVAFEAWCTRKGFGLKDDEAQYSFLFRELKGPEKKAVNAVKRAIGLAAKVKAFEAAFERAGVKHYDARIRWAERALAAFNKSSGPVKSAAPAAPSVPTVPVSASPAQRPGLWQLLWHTLRGKDARVETAPAPAAAAPGSNQLRQVQELLAAKGYYEIGQPDGLDGPRTRGAIKMFRAENGLPVTDAVDDKLLAALTAAGPRQIAKGRAEATARDLREHGNEQVNTLDTMGWLGKALGIGSIVGGIQQSGMLDKATGTLQSAQETLGLVTTVLTSVIGVVQWCATHWYLFAFAIGAWMLFRVATGILNLVVLFRQGILARADR